MSLTNNCLLRVNLGCGTTPTPGWRNFDNSFTVRLARVSRLLEMLPCLGVIEQYLEFARVVRQHGIRWADTTRRIPLPDSSAEVVYSSHMIEHLDPQQEVPRFLTEAHRILVPGGVLRLAVPDLRKRAAAYLETQDADAFVASLLMANGTPHGILAVARRVLVGFRDHKWMYDARSLVRCLERHGFRAARQVPPGETTIQNPGPLNLREREGESVYVEARRG